MRYLIMKKANHKSSVKVMREIRDRLSQDIMDMTYEEEKEYLKQKIKNLKTRRKNQKIR